MKLVLAYLDPGTGSMVLQIIVGGVAAIGVAGRYYWQKVTGRSAKSGEAETPSSAAHAAAEDEAQTSAE